MSKARNNNLYGGKMFNSTKITSEDVEKNNENFSNDALNEERELFKRAILEGLALKISKLLKDAEDIKIPLPSRRGR